jgi:hypothetical protein
MYMGNYQKEGRGKERILRVDGDSSTLQIYIWRLPNETYQTLFEKEGKRDGNKMEVVSMFKVHYIHV